MRVDLSNIKVGDMLAIRNRNRWDRDAPTHQMLSVIRITTTQVCCRPDSRFLKAELKFRKSDGKQVGEDYVFAEIATPELIASTRAARERQERNQAAHHTLRDLDGKRLHQLKLTLEQTEALAAAWTAIKAMKTED